MSEVTDHKILYEHIRLAEHKLDQFLQGQGPGTLRAGIALQQIRAALVIMEKNS